MKKNTSASAPMPMQTNRNNGTLKGPKQKGYDVSKGTKEKPSNTMPKEKMACLDKGGKSCID